MTWGQEPELVAAIRSMMMGSRETCVRYTMPLGLHHLIGGDHYAPMPENPDPRRAGLVRALLPPRGRDRHRRSTARARGSDARRASTARPLRERWGDPATCPRELLLWFHRLPWDHRLPSGRTLWDELVLEYRRGADEARALEAQWKTLEGRVDEERYRAVLASWDARRATRPPGATTASASSRASITGRSREALASRGRDPQPRPGGRVRRAARRGAGVPGSGRRVRGARVRPALHASPRTRRSRSS